MSNMKRIFIVVILGFVISVSPGIAAELDTAKEYLQKKMFIVETDSESAVESLDRISGGTYDRGFASPNSSYQSTNQQSHQGPFTDNEDRSSVGPGFSY